MEEIKTGAFQSCGAVISSEIVPCVFQLVVEINHKYIEEVLMSCTQQSASSVCRKSQLQLDDDRCYDDPVQQTAR